MSAVYETVLSTLDGRYEGGFDRLDRGARAGRSILWRASEHVSFALGEGRSVWVWEARSRIWNRIPAGEANIILREHDLAMARLRRALPVIRLYLNLPPGGERDAARHALQRIGTAIVEMWQEARAQDSLRRGAGWFDSSSAVYRAVTRDVCLHLPTSARIAFDPGVFAELAASDLADMTGARRQQPPRTGPNDLMNMPANDLGQTTRHDFTHPFAYQAARAGTTANARSRDCQDTWNAQIEQFRADIQRDVSHLEVVERNGQRRRHRAVLCGIVMGGVCTATALLALTIAGFG